MAATLKPCPFCGKPANCLQGRIHVDLLTRIGCATCGYWCEFESLEAALAWWNYREKRKGIEDEPSDSLACMIASEEVLGRDWNSPEDNEAWKDL